ncbi:hypothetical protein RE432_18355 [Pusillimonas sp. SM2304]|uniref:hypothetical protein n=1 Tax=Pusillimonas sp. SM2304 TaxID=3073241 RepID=UPI0028769228|nr:hypothetical protein [Pusillimonas sp. SM2304]MDS1142400.1 hypothetical protein [Pusillimonas sp. SM2304]
MQPVKYDADGRIVVNDTDAIVSWANGLPFTADGSLAVSGDLPVVVNGGVPAGADGKVTVSA